LGHFPGEGRVADQEAADPDQDRGEDIDQFGDA
jgi:hypothetical protein